MDSPVIAVAIGLVFTFGVVAALSAVITELVSRLLGLRARFLLLGLRELVDGDEVSAVNLTQAEETFRNFRTLAVGASATEALLGSPIMRAQGMSGTVAARDVTIMTATGATTGSAAEAPGGTTSGSATRLPKIGLGQARRWLLRNPLRSLPSYISSRTFSAAVLDLVVPDANNQTTLTGIREQVASIHGFPALTEQLQSLLKASEDSVEAYRASVERWYDDHMDRVSGWYKRHIAKWSLALGALLVMILNLNSVAIAQSLYTNEEVRTAVVAVATEATQCEGMQGAQLDACLDTLTDQLQRTQDAGLPIGWQVVEQCQPPSTCASFGERYGLLAQGQGWVSWHPLLVLVGWLLTVVALVPGARFWFDLLGRLGSLRTTGPKPT